MPARFRVLVSCVVLMCTPSLFAQFPTYSIDYQGPTIAVPDAATGTPITEGDILGAALMPLGIPPLVISGGFGPPVPGLGLPLHPPAVGHPPGAPGLVEVDALSYGLDRLDDPNPALFVPLTWAFSVDEFATGLQPPVPLPPNVSTEGAAFFPAGPLEASADVFVYFPAPNWGPGIAPAPPFIPPPGNTDSLDGDGTVPIGPFGLGLIEPNVPSPGPFDAGDNLDAVDVDFPATPNSFPVYFSLDSGQTVFDPIDGLPGSGSAIANGPFVGGDVLVTPAPGAGPFVYAPAPLLGLDLLGPDTDDLDALILFENGDGVFTPSMAPYDWAIPGAPQDMLFFSVRRGSAIIGTPDFYLGVPICEGDILVPAGPPGTPPGIWCSAESLGLCTYRGGVPAPGCPMPLPPWGPFSDDVDALDLVADCDVDGIVDEVAIFTGLVPDCNGNNRPDSCDIALGTSLDTNGNGIPDECEAQRFVRGDCNADGGFNIADAVSVLSFLFPTIPPFIPPCDDACDSNDSGTLDIADAVYILNALFAGGPLPPAPHPGCGLDPTMDALGCNSFPPCP